MLAGVSCAFRINMDGEGSRPSLRFHDADHLFGASGRRIRIQPMAKCLSQDDRAGLCVARSRRVSDASSVTRRRSGVPSSGGTHLRTSVRVRSRFRSTRNWVDHRDCHFGPISC
jgi:hypothetical protein